MRSPRFSPKPKSKPLLRRVVGQSMLPTYRPGQVVVVLRTAKLTVGDVVMFSHDGMEKIKRIARQEAGRLYVLGDNPGFSTDSRSFGWIGVETVVGKIVWPKR